MLEKKSSSLVIGLGSVVVLVSDLDCDRRMCVEADSGKSVLCTWIDRNDNLHKLTIKKVILKAIK